MSRPSLVPIIVLFVVLVVLGVVGYIAYSIIQDVTKNTREKLEGRNVIFSKDGMKVGVKELKDEEYRDRSQSVLVNMWNHTSFPAYKSRLWNMAGTDDKKQH